MAPLKTQENQLERLNRILRAMRNINQLIVKEKELTPLLQGICDNFIANRGYYNAWVTVFDAQQQWLASVEAGLGEQFSPLIQQFQDGHLPDCVQQALTETGVVLTEDPFSSCRHCPLSKIYAGRGAMTVRLEHNGRIYGMLCVSIPRKLVPEKEEQVLLAETAADIAFAMHSLQLDNDRQKAEEALCESERQLRIQDKMASLGRVAAGIAHEIRNPLSGINIYLNTLEKFYEKMEGSEKVIQILGQLHSASNKIESVIKRVMDFSKHSDPKFVSVDINQPIKDAIKLSAVSLRKNGIATEIALAEHLPPCRADPHLIEEMVLNLINNASEALRNKHEERKIAVATFMENHHIIIRISDSGPGVPMNLRPKILEPFFTTKHEGTGIGLNLIQRIITDHGGSLEISESKWGGAEFRVAIPS